MAVTAKWYGLAFKSIFNKEVDIDSDTLKVALCTSSYTPNQDTHQYFDVSVTNQVANGNGYTTGGATLTGVTVSYNTGTNVISIDANDVSWTSATFTARYAVVYDSTPASSKPLLFYVDFGADQSPSNGTLQITWDAAGLGYVTVS